MSRILYEMVVNLDQIKTAFILQFSRNCAIRASKNSTRVKNQKLTAPKL